MQSLIEIQRATLSARSRTGDPTIGTRADGGRLQVVRVTYPNGAASVVEPVSGWMLIPAAVAYLDSMK